MKHWEFLNHPWKSSEEVWDHQLKEGVRVVQVHFDTGRLLVERKFATSPTYDRSCEDIDTIDSMPTKKKKEEI